METINEDYVPAQLVREDSKYLAKSVVTRLDQERKGPLKETYPSEMHSELLALLADYVVSLQYFRTFRWSDESTSRLATFEESGRRLDDLGSMRIFMEELKRMSILKHQGKCFAFSVGKQSVKLPEGLWPVVEIILRKLRELAALAEENPRNEGVRMRQYEKDLLHMSPDDLDKLLQKAFVKKLKDEQQRIGRTDFFTETDQVVAGLLRLEKEESDGPHHVWRGSMKIIRVHDARRDGEMAIRMFTRFLCMTTVTDGPKWWKPSKENRNDPGMQHWSPPFAVVGDFGDSDNKSLVSKVDDHFRENWILSRHHPDHDARRGTLNMIVDRRKMKKTATPDLQYSDLYGVPMLLILCDKGRMGDTFPQTFDCLDLRLRTSRNFTTFVQEMGRLCRYPMAHPVKDENHTFSWQLESDRATLDEATGEGSQTIVKAATKSMFERSVSIMPSNKLIAIIVQKLEKHRMFTSLPDQDKSNHVQLLPLRLEVNGEFKEDYIPSRRELKECIDELKVKLQEIISDEAASQVPEALFITVTQHLHPLPYALIRPDVYQTIQSGAKKAAKAPANSPMSEILPNYARPSQLDRYLSPNKGLTHDAIFNFRENYTASTGSKSERAPGSLRHYDADNTEKDSRRLLLQAECQIGKTGAYIALLARLQELLQPSGVSVPRIPEPNFAPDDAEMPGPLEWCYPAKDTSPKFRGYGSVETGKYHPRVKLQRIAWLIQAVRACDMDRVEEGRKWFDEYMKLVKTHEVPMTKAANTRIRDLEDKFNEEQPRKPRTHDVPHHQVSMIDIEATAFVGKLLDWDGRLGDGQSDGGYKKHLEKLEKLIQFDKHATDAFGHTKSYRLTKTDAYRNDLVQFLSSWEVDKSTENEPVMMVRAEEAQKMKIKTVCLSNWLRDVDLSKLFGPEHSTVKLCTSEGILNQYLERSPSGDVTGVNLTGETSPFREQKHIKHVIFIPTHNRFKACASSGKALLDWTDAVEDGWKYLRVLVVRDDEEQVEGYKTIASSTIEDVSALKDLPGGDECVQALHKQHITTLSADQMGLGYARFFIQLISYLLKLPWVWMLDDNIQNCYQLDVDSIVKTGKHAAPPQSAHFSTVMAGIEQQLVYSDKHKVPLHIKNQNDYLKLEASNDPQLADYQCIPLPNDTDSKLEDYTGKQSDYGLFGVARNLERYSKIGTSKGEWSPINDTPSVYSMVLMNVAETMKQGAYYPAKPFWEDLEFSHLCREKGLRVVKFWRFIHHKTPGGLQLDVGAATFGP
eukprot:gene2143-2845_t